MVTWTRYYLAQNDVKAKEPVKSLKGNPQGITNKHSNKKRLRLQRPNPVYTGLGTRYSWNIPHRESEDGTLNLCVDLIIDTVQAGILHCSDQISDYRL